jgi:hypothetical protein
VSCSSRTTLTCAYPHDATRCRYFTPWNHSPSLEGDDVFTVKERGDGEHQLPESAVRKSCFRACRYNLGSVALAALIIAVIQFVQACIVYAERKAKESGMNETLRKLVFCLLMCFVKCVECCMKQVNRNGLVMVAVYGTPFCPATCGAFELAFASLGRVAWISMVGDMLMGVGKVLVALLTTGITGLLMYVHVAYWDCPLPVNLDCGGLWVESSVHLPVSELVLVSVSVLMLALVGVGVVVPPVSCSLLLTDLYLEYSLERDRERVRERVRDRERERFLIDGGNFSCDTPVHSHASTHSCARAGFIAPMPPPFRRRRSC